MREPTEGHKGKQTRDYLAARAGGMCDTVICALWLQDAFHSEPGRGPRTGRTERHAAGLCCLHLSQREQCILQKDKVKFLCFSHRVQRALDFIFGPRVGPPGTC